MCVSVVCVCVRVLVDKDSAHLLSSLGATEYL